MCNPATVGLRIHHDLCSQQQARQCIVPYVQEVEKIVIAGSFVVTFSTLFPYLYEI